MHRVSRRSAVLLGLTLAACAASPPQSSPPVSVPPSASTLQSQPAPSPSAGAEPRADGILAFLRDSELITLDVASGTETATGITDVVPVAFTTDHAGLIGTRKIGDDPYVVSLVQQPTDGSEATVLLEELPAFGGATLAPNGRFLLLNGDGSPGTGIVLVDLETGEAAQLTTDGAFAGTWSPDGTRIAYARQADSEGQDLFLRDVATGSTRQLTNDEWEDTPFRWSEDGAGILTTSHRRGDGSRLAISTWQVDASSGELTERPDLETDVVRYELLSPDGRWRARISPQNILSITEPDRGAGNRLGDADPSIHLTWSPNAAWLVWTAWQGPGTADLFMAHAPDGEPIQLTDTAESESHPVWGPVRHGF
jgi:dipeptidyl aminopeptidase/acylaminoacyl peptidase